jgi:phosphocarrier protein
MIHTELEIINETGLHARPAELFVRAANRFNCDIQISNLTTGSPYKNGKNILQVLSLGIYRGHRISLTASGVDEKEALAEISRMVNNNFDIPSENPAG